MASTGNKLLDLNGLQYFWNEAKTKFVEPALLNGGLNFEYLTTQYYWCPNRPEYDSYQGKPTEPQGVVYLGDNKVVSIACPYRSHSNDDNTNGVTEGAPLLTDKSEFKVFAGINQPQYSTIDATYQISGLGHSNSLSYIPEKNLLLVSVHSYSTILSGSGLTAKYKRWHSKDIKVIDPTNGYQAIATISVNTDTVVTEIHDTYSKDVTISNLPFVAYDKIKKKLYGWVGDFYLIEIPIPTDNQGNIITGQVVAHLVTRITKPQVIGGGQQGLAVMGDFVFLIKNFPNQVWVFSLAQNKIVRCYTIPDYDCFGHKIHYVEGIDYDPDTGDFYLASFVVTSYWQRRKSQYKRACYIHRFNPFKDSPGAFNSFGYYDKTSGTYVYTSYYSADSNAVRNLTVNLPSKVTPHQRGDDYYPFGTIGEAITALQSGKFPQAYMIYFLSSGLYDEYVTITNVECNFNGENITVHGLDIQNSRIKFNNVVTVDGTNVKNAPPLYIHSSNVGFNGFSLTGNIDIVTDSDPAWALRALLYAAESEVDCSSGSYTFNGGSNCQFDISLVRSKFISANPATSVETNSAHKVIRLSNSEWRGGRPEPDWDIRLIGCVRGGFNANKISDGDAPYGFLRVAVQTENGDDIRGYGSALLYKGSGNGLVVHSLTPYGTVKTTIDSNGNVTATAFDGTPNPSGVTCSTTFVEYG